MKKKATVLLMALLLIALMIGMIACDPQKITEKQDAVITVNEKSLLAVFNGKEHSVEATLNHKEAQLSYSPQQGYTEAGEYKITISAPETDNYKAVSKEVTLVIKKAKAGELVVSPDWNAKIPFDGTSHKVTAMVAGREDAVITYDPEIANTTGYTEVGEYSVKITVAADNNYEEIVDTLTFSIVPKHGEVYDEFKQALADNFTSAQDGTSVSFSTVFSLKQGDQAQSAVLDFKANFKDDVIASTMAVTISQDDALVLGLYLKDGKFYLERPNGENVWTDASTLLPLIEEINVNIPADTITMIETMLKQYLFAAADSAIHNTVTGEFEFNLDLAWIYDNLYDDLGSIIAPFIDKVLTYQVTDKEGVVSTKYVFEFTDGKGNVVGLSSANLGEFLRVSDLGASMNAKFTDGALNASLTAKGFGTELGIELKDLKVSGAAIEIADLDEKTNVENYTQIKPVNFSLDADLKFVDEEGQSVKNYKINLKVNVDPSALVGKDLKTQWPSALKEMGMFTLSIMDGNDPFLNLTYDPANSQNNNLYIALYLRGMGWAVNTAFDLDELAKYMNGDFSFEANTPSAAEATDIDSILNTVQKVLKVITYIPQSCTNEEDGTLSIDTVILSRILNEFDIKLDIGSGPINLADFLFGKEVKTLNIGLNSVLYGDTTLDAFNAYEVVQNLEYADTGVTVKKVINQINGATAGVQTNVLQGTDLVTLMNEDAFTFDVTFADGTTGKTNAYVYKVVGYNPEKAGAQTVKVYMVPTKTILEGALYEMAGIPIGMLTCTVNINVIDYADQENVTLEANGDFNVGDNFLTGLKGRVVVASDSKASVSIRTSMLNMEAALDPITGFLREENDPDRGTIYYVAKAGAFTLEFNYYGRKESIAIRVSEMKTKGDSTTVTVGEDILTALEPMLTVTDRDGKVHTGAATAVAGDRIVDGKFTGLSATNIGSEMVSVMFSFVDEDDGNTYTYTTQITVKLAKNSGSFNAVEMYANGLNYLTKVANLYYTNSDDKFGAYTIIAYEDGKYYMKTSDAADALKEEFTFIIVDNNDNDVTEQYYDKETGKFLQPENTVRPGTINIRLTLVSNPEITWTSDMFGINKYLDKEAVFSTRDKETGADLVNAMQYYVENQQYWLNFVNGAYVMVKGSGNTLDDLTDYTITFTDKATGEEIAYDKAGKFSFVGTMVVTLTIDGVAHSGDMAFVEPPLSAAITADDFENGKTMSGKIKMDIDVRDGKGSRQYFIMYDKTGKKWVLQYFDMNALDFVTDTRFTVGKLTDGYGMNDISQCVIVDTENAVWKDILTGGMTSITMIKIEYIKYTDDKGKTVDLILTGENGSKLDNENTINIKIV